MDTITNTALLTIGIVCFLPNVIFIQAIPVTCGSHHCSGSLVYCELFVNSGGLQGQCQAVTWILQHHTIHACTTAGADKEHCYCTNQACVNSVKDHYAHHHPSLHCGRRACQDEYCMISDRGRSLHCGNKTLHKSSCSTLHDDNTVCYCSTQQCIDSYLAKVTEHTDSHVTCGNHTCHVHSGDVCVLTNDGKTHNYHGHTSSFNLNCHKEGHMLHTTPRCVSPPQYGQPCSCVSQPCIKVFSADLLPITTLQPRNTGSCSDIPTLTKHRCARYQSQLHMCESTNPVVKSIASGDCKTYCLLCRSTTTEAPAVTTQTTTVTTKQTTTVPTTTVVYPACVQTNCAHLYLRYCHLYQTNNVIEGRCMPFQVGPVCSNYTELQGNGCTCETTECSIHILTAYSHHMGSISTTTVPIATSTMSISTTVDGYECFGQICSSTNTFCHLYEYLDHLDARCMPFNTWNECKVYTDLHGSGCSCTSKTCAESVVKDYVNHISITTLGQNNIATTISSTRLTTTSPTTISPTMISPTTGLHCFNTICAVNEVCRVYLDNANLYAGYCILKNVEDLLICKSSTLTMSTECDCALQSCIDSYTVSKSTSANPTTTIQTLSSPKPLIITNVPSTQLATLTISASSATRTLSKSANTNPTTTIQTLSSPKPPIITNVPPSVLATLTISASSPTPTPICQDKPGVDCLLLNSTNICANPFSHQYCANFCGHCTRVIQSAFG